MYKMADELDEEMRVRTKELREARQQVTLQLSMYEQAFALMSSGDELAAVVLSQIKDKFKLA